ncbi:MAG TPA: RNA polymerase sigma factor [Candidatus Paceibacterota bacterium]|jgi:RNA polymerase sigma-70 factor (ECF subfamily)|nr:RNA polymerase sigma factor [Candidatus Paceibacterota bacterium]
MTTREITSINSILTDAHRNFQRDLNSRAFFKVSDYEMGQDLVQETFLKTWKHLVNGGKIHMMRAFLYHVLNHLIIDEYRKHKTSSLDDLLEKGFEVGTNDTEHLFNTLDGEILVKLIKDLPEKYKKVVHLRFIKDLSLKEISDATGKSKNNIAVQIHRGLSQLKSLYKHA